MLPGYQRLMHEHDRIFPTYERCVINVGGDRCGKVARRSTLAEVFLLVGNKMLGACHDTGSLHALDRLVHADSRQDRVGREALPVL